MILIHQHNKHTHTLYTLHYKAIHASFLINLILVLSILIEYQE